MIIEYLVTTNKRTSEERHMLVIGLEMVKGVAEVTPDPDDPTLFVVEAKNLGVRQSQAMLVIEGVIRIQRAGEET